MSSNSVLETIVLPKNRCKHGQVVSAYIQGATSARLIDSIQVGCRLVEESMIGMQRNG